MTRVAERVEEAWALADEAEALVRDAEAALEAATDPTMRDALATRLDELYALQDETLAAVGPAIEASEQELQRRVREACRSAAGDPGSDWVLKYRRWMAPAVKARIARAIGHKKFMRMFPW